MYAYISKHDSVSSQPGFYLESSVWRKSVDAYMDIAVHFWQFSCNILLKFCQESHETILQKVLGEKLKILGKKLPPPPPLDRTLVAEL